MRRFLFSGEGRLDRLGYLIALLAAAILFVAPAALLLPSVVPDAFRWPDGDTFNKAVLGAGAVIWTLVAWIYCAATARRLHDIDRSGWLTLMAIVPVVGASALTLALLLLPGNAGPNRFGSKWL